MPFRINTATFTVEVDTFEEFQAVIRELGGGPSMSPGSQPTIDRELSRRYRAFWRQLGWGGEKIIRVLFGREHGLRYDLVLSQTKLSHTGFGGALGGIARVARANGLHESEILKRTSEVGEDGQMHVILHLSEQLRQFIRQFTPKGERL